MRCIILAAVIFLLPISIHAQSLDGSMDPNPFTFSMLPQYPEPYGEVLITPRPNTASLSGASMTASMEGKVFYQGAVQPVRVTLGNAGSVTAVRITISSGGIPTTETVYIQPQDVTLVVEPISSTPPLYQGKSLVPLEGSARIVAVANFKDARGGTLKPSSLSYEWTVDGQLIPNSSGIGKSAILVASPLQYRARTISVEVKSATGNLVGGSTVSITAQEPTVLIYKNDPLLGVRFNNALKETYTIAGVETSLYGTTYSFPTTIGDPSSEWILNGAKAQTGSTITLRPSGVGEGNASLVFSATSNGSVSAVQNLILSFGKEASSLFNL